MNKNINMNININININKKAPIGVFDSGIGGVTVLQDLVKAFPHEDFIFIGDTAHCPYGTKTEDELHHLTCNVGMKLVEMGAKAVVIACNTATANSQLLHEACPVDIVGAIEPTAHLASQTTQNGHIAILATKMTIGLKAYEHYLDQEKRLEELKGTCYYPLACQDFVRRVEAGETGTEDSFKAVSDYLTPLKDKDVDTVILGCTHFPRLIPEISAALPKATLVASGEAMGQVLKGILDQKDLHNDESHHGTIKLYTTGDAEYMKKQTTWFPYTVDSYEHVDIK